MLLRSKGISKKIKEEVKECHLVRKNIITTVTSFNSHHGFVILLKNNIVVMRTEPVENETDCKGKKSRNTKTMRHNNCLGSFLNIYP